MTGPLFLGIDAGQTTVKAVVHDDRLHPVATGRRSSPVHHPRPRFAERTQDELWASAAGAIADAVSQVDASRIAAIGISGHGDGLHLVDDDGGPVSPAITAMDGRAFREWQRITGVADRAKTILEVSGQQAPLGGAGPLLAWMRENDPDATERAAHLIWCKDVLRLRLIGGRPETDLSDATASFLDMRRGEWSREVLEAYDLGWAERLLPPLRRSADIAGAVTADAVAATGLAEGTPVVVGLHDVQASAIGSAALVPGRLSLIAGSFSTNGVTTTGDEVDPRWQCRVSIRPDLRVAMSTSPTASPALEWAVRVFGGEADDARDALFAEAAALEPDADTPAMLPYLLGSPLGDAPTAAFAGIGAGHGRGHVFRGVLEGIVCMHVWHTRALATSYDWSGPIRLGGGISRSPLYVQMVADAMGQPVSVVRGDEVGAFGAAAVAALGVGHFASIDEAQELVELADPVVPRVELAGHWQRIVARFDALNDSLAPWWNENA
ncbi:FGGY-family carbohydrate kinase [Microbacterium halotolerans]|uniref:FGGY-family carbohydrate kinase n=1 Tax=Microbacterium halotolerans TaxID=246613 RepID=UPI000E6ABA6C|nr:FGGY family carbohydrate kinase [Microbacterium halotolerans]